MAKSILDFKKITGGKSGKSFKKVLARSDGRVLWSAGSTVTYVVDTGTSYTEEVDSGASCLSPTTFTPSKDGWTFVGWREDTTASGSVLSSKVMESDPITLYAVFKQTVSAKFISYNSTQTVDGTRYYNYGNIENASVTVPTGATYSGWSWRGWGNNWVADATADVAYANGGTVYGLSEDRTYYGLYKKTITAYFISGIGGTNNQPIEGTSYYNSAGNVSTIDITAPTGAAASGWTWRGWSKYWDQAAAASVYLKNGGTTNINHENDGITYYGLYRQTITLSYNGNGSTSGSVAAQTGTRYHNSANNYSDPSFRLAANGFTKSGYTFNGWNLGAVGASITLDANATAYAQWTMVSILTNGVWQSSASSVSNGSMSYSSDGYLYVDTLTKDGDTTYTGPSFNVDVTGLSTISFTVYLSGYCSTDAAGSATITFAIGNNTVKCEHYADDAAATQTLTIDVSSLTGVQSCGCSILASCRQEEDEWGWSDNHHIRIYNIVPA